MTQPAQAQNPISMMLSVLAGSGFQKFTKGTKELAESGLDLNKLMSMPGMPLMMAGAGLKDAANSLEIAGPLIQQFMPPQPPPQEEPPAPEKVSAAMSMLSARLSPGLGGLSMSPQMGPNSY